MEINKILKSLRVPALIYDWELQTTPKIEKKILSYVDNIDTMLREGRSIFFNMKDGVQASRLAVWILRKTIEAGYLNVGYTVPESIAESKAESWEDGDSLSEMTLSDLLVIDRIVFSQLDTFKLKALYGLIEGRLLNKRSTLMVSDEDLKVWIPSRILTIMNYVEVKYIC